MLLQGLFSNPRENAQVARPSSLQSQFGGLYSGSSRLQSGPGVRGEHGLSGIESGGLRGKDSLYGIGEVEAQGPSERNEPEGFYKPSASHQLATPNLEDIFSRMSMERTSSTQGPAMSGGQGRSRD